MMTTIEEIEKAFTNACEHYNKCVLKNDRSSVDAVNGLVTATVKYRMATGNYIKFVGDKDTEDVTGHHTIKRAYIIKVVARFQF